MRIIIIEDHRMFREVLCKICTEMDHDVIAEAGDGIQAINLIRRKKPDLVLLDLQLPWLDGFGVIESTHRVWPDTRILVLSSHCEASTVYRLEKARVHGFIDKNTNSVAALKGAIREVILGGVFFSQVYQQIRQQRLDDSRSFDKILGDRERAIVTFLAIPLSDKEIAQRLGIAKETVEKHRQNILGKLQLRTTTELVRYANKLGFGFSSL